MSKILLKPHHGFRFFSHSRQLSTVFFRKSSLHAIHNPHRSQNPRCLHPIRTIESSSTKEGDHQKAPIETALDDGASHPTLLQSSPSSESRNVMASGKAEYPSGEYEIPDFGWWMKTMVKLRMMFAFPWEHVKKGSVLSIKLRGRITDQLTSRFSPGMSLPQVCENFLKAANDTRISGIYIHIEPLSCGWGKIDEIRRHILNFRKSGKFTVSYIPIFGEKEYYLACACGEVYAPPSAYVLLYGLNVQASFLGGVLEKIGVDPQIQQIGKYKSAGDLLVRKGMSKENCEMLTSLLNDIHGNWLETISSTLGKTLKEVEEFINTGVYQVEKLKENGWITNTLYDDEVMSILKDRLGQTKRKNLLKVDYG